MKVTVLWPLSWEKAKSVHGISHCVDALVVHGLPVPVHIATWQAEAAVMRARRNQHAGVGNEENKSSRWLSVNSSFMPRKVLHRSSKARSGQRNDVQAENCDIVIPFNRNRVPAGWQHHPFWIKEES